jgi:CHASE3 domain sensor protein
MKWLKKIERNIITVSVYFILFFIAGNGLLDYYYRGVLKEHEAIVKQVENGRASVKSLLETLNLVDLGFRGFYIIPKDNILSPCSDALEKYPNVLAKARSVVEAQGLNSQELTAVDLTFQEYFSLVKQMIVWRQEGNIAPIDSVIALDPGFIVWQQYDTFSKSFFKKQDEIISQSQAKADKIVLISTVVRVSLFLLGIPTLIIILIRLKKDRARRSKLFLELDKNNKQYLFDPKETDISILNERLVINNLINNLRKASEFISNIAKGKFDVQWEGMHEGNRDANKESLAGELWSMRDQMIKMKEEDNVRLWATEGISKFSEIVRHYQDDMAVLSDKLTSNVVKYLGANQSALFFAIEDASGEVTLELYGCYAYDRKKHQEKSLAPGQSLVGQAYMEKNIIHLTAVPQSYVRITSGLGEATPTNLIIVPLKFNERVEGVLEIASFKPFRPHEIEFLEKIAEIIASAIVTLQGSVKMKKLMETMQIQSEEMKSQEEEMRQNMEELQATQEEVSRKAIEYQSLIIEKDKLIQKKLEEITTLRKQLGETKG